MHAAVSISSVSMIKGICIVTLSLVLYIEYSHAQCEQGCANGGTCSGSICLCDKGWYGKRCHRPCQDVFKSCERWKEEGRCEWDSDTKYFDDHCPHSCNNCVFDNRTVVEYPLPPLLEPIEFFIGTWKGESSTPDHFPLDFESGGYEEEIRIMATDMPAFDRPCLNYTAKAISKLDSYDVQYDTGFFYVKPGKNETVVGIMTTGNTGIMLVQEGLLNGNQVKFTTTFEAAHPWTRLEQAHVDSTRTMEISGSQLSVTIVNQKQSYVKYYTRV